MGVQLGTPGQAAGIQQPAVGGAALIGDAGLARHASFGVLVAGLGLAARVQFQEQDLLAARTEQRQQAVRGSLRQRLGVFEIVTVLGAFGFLALGHAGTDHAGLAQPGAQLTDQRGIFAPALHQDRACTFQRSLGVGHALVGVDKGSREDLRVLRRVGQQAISQRFQTGLAGDLGAGTALGLVRQVQVFQPALGVGGQDVVAQVVAELALLADAGQHRRATVFQFAQVGQAHFQVAQLGVVQAPGHFLAVARDERNAGALVEQADGGTYLGGLGTDLVGDGLGDLLGERALGVLGVVHCFRSVPRYGKTPFWQSTTEPDKALTGGEVQR